MLAGWCFNDIFLCFLQVMSQCHENLCPSELDVLLEGRRVPFSLQLSAGREMWHTEGGSIFSLLCKGSLDREMLRAGSVS